MTTKRLFLRFLFLVLLLAALPAASTAVLADEGAPPKVTATPTVDPAALVNTNELAGWFSIIWGDPEPGSGLPHQALYWLRTDDGTLYQLDLDQVVVGNGGSLLALDRKRVVLRGRPSSNMESTAAPSPQPLIDVVTIDLGAGVDAAASALPVSGSQPWVSILCKFADVAAEPKNLAYFQNMYGSTAPGLNHYWQEASYGLVNVNGSGAFGWFTLPHNRSFYIPANGSANLDLLRHDCVTMANAAVFFPNYIGINMMFNDNLDCCAWGGGGTMTLDGVTRHWNLTWEPPWAFQTLSVIEHEMGHGFGLPHSWLNSQGDYGNAWDVMSWDRINCGLATDPTYGCLGQHTIAHYRDALGWIPAARKYVAGTGTQTITLERTTQPATNNFLIAEIPSSSRLYTLEVRKRVGYDVKLPGDAVIIHEVDHSRGEWARVIDSDGNSNSSDAGAMWQVGEVFSDPANDVTVRIDSATSTGFVVTIVLAADPHEPNNATGQATPIAYGAVLTEPRIDPAGDLDFYRFTGQAGDVITADVDAATLSSSLDSVVSLLNSAGSQLAENDDDSSGFDSLLSFTLPANGTYYLKVRDFSHPNEGGPGYFYTLKLSRSSSSNGLVNLSAAANGSVGGLAYQAADIIAHNPVNNTWQMVFDASDVNLACNVNSFAFLADGSLLLSFKANCAVPNGVGTVLPHDVVRFTPTSLGNNTAGSFAWYFDGSDVALTTTAEKIDAIAITPNGRLAVSTAGTPAVTGVSGARDEDLLVFTASSIGANTTGTWSLFFDGSNVPGLAAENVVGATVDPATECKYLTLSDGFTISGVSGTSGSVLKVCPLGGGNFQVSLFWHGPNHGFSGVLDGFEIDW